MPRLFHRPPKYGLHKGTKQAIVCSGGKMIYLGPYGSKKSHERYQEFLQQWRAQRHEQQLASSKQARIQERIEQTVTPAFLRTKQRQGLVVTLDELIYVFRRHAREYYVKNGEVTREAELIEEITERLGLQYGPMNVNEFGSVELEEFRDQLVQETDWTRKFYNKQINRIRLMFKWGAKKEICLASAPEQLKTLEGLKKGKTTARETEAVKCVDQQHYELTLPLMPPIVADMARFQMFTGARPGEVCSIRPCDIDQSDEVWVYVPDSHKTEHHEKDRVVAIGPRAQKVLQPYLDRTTDSFCFSPKESVELRRQRQSAQRVTPLSCGNRPGSNRKQRPRRVASDKYKVASYRMAIRKACNKAGIAVWTPNQLRHNAATKARKLHGLDAAQAILGHANANVTQVYAELDLNKAKQSAKEAG